jgi:MFS family permease
MPGGSIVRALSHRNFRLFFVGQTLSLVGTWAQSTAMPLLVYRLTNSAALLGLVGFLAQLPSFFLTPFAGVVADRVNRRRLLLVTQSLAMLQAFGLAALVWSGHVQVWHVVLFNFSLNAVNAFDMTTRQTFLSDLLADRRDLANAIALNSSMVQLARLFGPYLAAVLIGAAGEAACFFANGLTFFAVLAALAAMRMPRPAAGRPRGQLSTELADGARYAARSAPIRSLLLVVTMVSVVGMPYTVLLPVYNDRVLHGDERTFAHLLLAVGFGALAASLVLAWRGLRGAMTRVALAPVAIGIALAAFAFAESAGAALAGLFCVGFAVMVLINTCNSLIQAVVPDDKRGRVMSFYAMAFLGTSPLGSLFAGTSADLLGLHGALVLAGALCVCGGLVFAWRMRAWRAEVRQALCHTPEPEVPVVPEPAAGDTSPVSGEPTELLTPARAQAT